MSKIFAMSDIHGHYDEFIESLSKVDLSDKNNQLILLGDYIDGGSHSLFANYLYYDYAVNAR
ncbi:metallophosphoesterase [Streptococcus suis]|uniref:metallophosphoesterase n=1 Tax=Streptococcus suis TaxID=1307 RepID=UPI001ABEA133|nr:metallophosphoesterase [Streptococcus suis]MBO4129713.1 metallophosphoesterase [Streptococcus suis]